ncbi:AraC family transcriptional regulator [Mucilaginibacter rubeus]|uniref:AraC family transcriptional regulator n=1 Tax=Mucilaginibacter rubeus TaxID=2027860 RepID=A0AAE6JJ69_9SPHI|nr:MULTISPECIES: helix-turn-helix domain-containing protein [Mucilaginibacter]QEM06792.1 AraC family transcriptional regulator [Mucilaginibacter rubeus]QEM19379.1 AraC family transcriptional regulator [Mucilaginibacter gossypii]QTE44072.1 AraC family transcriptional regulator [Mucilaginibacter rubeus]QTE50673.1 AraC family transcriptional regulator [Mucilaginibacter rubeus]QTE55756.1 AraC family transcriptional regulator [Mucilaginibacter rubeus]
MQIAPHPLLSDIVKHYLIIAHDQRVALNYRLFSDGNPGMVFHLKAPLLQYNQQHTVASKQPGSFVYGQITNYNDIVSVGELAMLIVVLQPNTLLSLLGVAACELNNNTVPLKDLFGQETFDLEDQIANAANLPAATVITEQFLLNKMASKRKRADITDRAINIIHANKGIINVKNLLDVMPVTERQLERKFDEEVGISPKKYIDVVKFQNYLKQLQKLSSIKELSSLSYACGYYDQAHLNNFFRKHTGLTPLQYKANHHLLAINFMPLV